ncbi:MAG: sodium:solute symporter [Candidatus Kapabacteria bacterium]|nr:sodium:solute symporter [Candidatus Kapabacteria bacterium]
MSPLDWGVFLITLSGVMWYGLWRGRGNRTADDYLRAGQSMPWYSVLLGVMATQASAITFLSAPGQAFTDGMRFVQYYFGLPLAMIVISVVFIPMFRRFNVYTAYEFLEQRFDRRVRLVTSVLFLLSRGLSTGISIYAPSIIVATLLDMNIYATNVIVGGLLLVYTLSGGARSVAYTQTLMFGIILASMLAAGYFLVQGLPLNMSMSDALYLTDIAGKFNVITTTFDLHDKYNIWSGLIGGFFLALSYFGTDQSQVGRFITGKNIRESRIGLLVNGVVKIPMQYGILLIGALLVALYSVVPSPIFFNESVAARARYADSSGSAALEQKWGAASTALAKTADGVLARRQGAEQEYRAAYDSTVRLRAEYRTFVRSTGIMESNDTNYIFLHYVRTMLPAGLIGLIFAVVIMASWGSISAGFHSLATASVVDLRGITETESDIRAARWHTLLWAVFGIAMSMLATQMGSLIEAVNILGSLFYGPILGIFLVAFFVRKANGTDVFRGAIVAEVLVVAFWIFNVVSFLWLNVVGTLAVVIYCYVSSANHREAPAQSAR